MAIRASIRAGACGFGTDVHATCADGLRVALQLESDCPKVQAMAAALPELSAVDEVLRKPLVGTTPAKMAGQYRLHASCPVPVGILKAVEAAAGLALPTRCEICLEQTT